MYLLELKNLIESFDAEDVPSIVGEARGASLQCASGGSVQGEGGVADISEPDRDAVEAREDFWIMSGEFLYRNHVMSRENCMLEANENQFGQIGRERYYSAENKFERFRWFLE